MKVVLQKPVDKLGAPGDVVDVADGYARNYLVPRGIAVKATRGMVRHQESLKRAHEARVAKGKTDAEATASRLMGTRLVVSARAGEEGRLFGSITADAVAEQIREQAGVEVDRRDVHLAEPIRSVGVHEVRVRLYPEVEPILSVEVVAAQ
jgi:large subunit ribosomal protein L9